MIEGKGQQILNKFQFNATKTQVEHLFTNNTNKNRKHFIKRQLGFDSQKQTCSFLLYCAWL
jgi:N-acetylglutamate synthase-like GNAT family acetyltransferase